MTKSSNFKYRQAYYDYCYLIVLLKGQDMISYIQFVGDVDNILDELQFEQSTAEIVSLVESLLFDGQQLRTLRMQTS